jgi:DnaJ-domain-containing protein 1
MADAFEVFHMEPQFVIDRTELERRHRALLAELHPSRQASAPEPTDVLFANQGEINAAYQQLSDPLARAELLLVRQGRSRSAAQSPELLARIFEQRQALEQAVSLRDASAVSNCVGAARARQEQLHSALASHFSRNAADAPPQQTAEIGPVLQELRYLNKLVLRGEQALDDLE